jgi:hypothetical protein
MQSLMQLGDLTPNKDVFTADFASAVDYGFLAPLEGAGLDPVRPQASGPEPSYVPSTFDQARRQSRSVHREPFVSMDGKSILQFAALAIVFSFLLRRGAGVF